MTNEQREKVRSMICSTLSEIRVAGALMSTSDIEWLMSIAKRINSGFDLIKFRGEFSKEIEIEIGPNEYNMYHKFYFSYKDEYFIYRKYTSYIGIFAIEKIPKQVYEEGCNKNSKV